jgi:hypothetical protein
MIINNTQLYSQVSLKVVASCTQKLSDSVRSVCTTCFFFIVMIEFSPCAEVQSYCISRLRLYIICFCFIGTTKKPRTLR